MQTRLPPRFPWNGRSGKVAAKGSGAAAVPSAEQKQREAREKQRREALAPLEKKLAEKRAAREAAEARAATHVV